VWIVPKTLQASLPFALDTVASSEDLNSLASTIESSLMWRSKPSPLQTWLRRWKRESWIRHLFGRILKPSQHTCFEIEWISLLADTHASPFRLRESEKAQTIQGTFGRTLEDTFKQSDLFDASSRTSRDTSASACKKSSQTWKQIVMKRRGEYSARLKSAHPTEGNESSLWPTPVAQDDNKSPEAHMQMKQRMKGGPRFKPTSLQVMVKGVERGLWPTPTTQDNPQMSGKDKRGTTLGGAVRQWPTPTASDSQGGPREMDGKRGRALKDLAQSSWPTPAARDWKDTPGMATQAGNRSRLDQLPRAVYAKNSDQKSGTLNPTWVEWLMGLPTGWTDLGSWATE